MSVLIVALPGSESIAKQLSHHTGAELTILERHVFPDGESLVRYGAPLEGRSVVLVGSLDRPDEKFLTLAFAAATARELGAQRVGLIAPYLSYMRQDRRFRAGEAVTSPLFAQLLSDTVDWLITLDPHLHRTKSLDAIYNIPAQAVHAAPSIAAWIAGQIETPLIVGPDGESRQWAADIAARIDAPCVTLEKVRHSDIKVEVRLPDLARWWGRTPVLVDDIVSSGRTMAEAVRLIRCAGFAAPVCIAVHAVFAPGAYETLTAADPAAIATTNSIAHISNAIDITGLLADAAASWIGH